VLPASYHGGALRDKAWEEVCKQYGMWKGNSWAKVDPVTWWYILVVELDVPRTAFDLTRKFPFTVASIPRAVQYDATAVVDAIPDTVKSPRPSLPDGAAMGTGVTQTKPPEVPVELVTAVPLASLYSNDDGAPATAFAWASMPGVETVEHRMDFENGRDANNEGAAAYAPVWPVAVEARAI